MVLAPLSKSGGPKGQGFDSSFFRGEWAAEVGGTAC